MRTGRGIRVLCAAGVAAAMLAAAGCGRRVLRVADASLGDYYTEKEFQKLDEEQRREYCHELALQDSIYVAEIRAGRETIASAEAGAAPLRREVDSLLAEAERREQNIRTASASGGRDEASSDRRSSWTVRPGDSLWRISRSPDVYGDGRKWPRIYESNRSRIRDPDLIHPGQELRIP